MSPEAGSGMARQPRTMSILKWNTESGTRAPA
eukprot:CAMPEP_0204575212 /NCGR_PEP_ID=MMETSP0661-20131031/41056_1 /ASSEMBLY_ACC=CAM_ASM_000606 /TAXON_ID=109239 /ORGANISM="Alexandrium margalefi, Strain AMGDE01CS-322" /LENGTH=31 /DNA_ID= /DNA_START= /DNA_END= /DNA_ORIENTATION=